MFLFLRCASSQSDCPKEAFQCNDGTCMSRSAVCNGRWECPDGSDEARCYKGKTNIITQNNTDVIKLLIFFNSQKNNDVLGIKVLTLSGM